MALIELKDVQYSYGKEYKAIDGVTFSVESGEYVAVIGKNGSGKSTLAKTINGLILPQSGTVTVDGFKSSDKESLFEIRKRVGVVFQNPDNQLVASIIEDDVAFGPENLGLPRKEIAERIDFALKAVGMEEFRRVSPERLSGGQKQRIAIAGVLALKPKVLVLDESTAMLDPKGRKEVLSIAEKLNKENGTTVIAITHYMDEVLKADKVLVMQRGKIVLCGTPKEVFREKERLSDMGLELPLAAVIAEKLRKKGVNIDEDVLTPQDLAEALCKS